MCPPRRANDQGRGAGRGSSNVRRRCRCSPFPGPPPPSFHRVLWRVAISLALGAMINVLVAWRCHRFGWMEGKRTKIENPMWPIRVPSSWPHEPRWGEWTEAGSIAFSRFIKHWPESRGGVEHAVIVYESGWPRRAMIRYLPVVGGSSPPKVPDIGMLHLGVPSPFNLQSTNIPHANYLPVLPLWPGFAINTIFYGTFVFAAMAGASALKRRRRIKRGLCVQCAYPITGLTRCPECGLSTAPATHSNLLPETPAPSPTA
jgi:hypothetical protein